MQTSLIKLATFRSVLAEKLRHALNEPELNVDG
jgi:hypothetical protein